MPPEELVRLQQAAQQQKPWKRWGPYLSERQWGTVREDYSPDGNCWDYFSHDQARSRAYRWGEDGLLGIADDQCRLAFALALWNERDPILKERLFGLTGPEGNHGEDVKELYYYLDSTPTHSYLKALYKYPQAAYPYGRLVEENRRRGKDEAEFELVDAGAFDDDRYFDVVVEYAKASPEDVLIRVTVANRGPETATIHVLPSLWFRNTWDWGREGDNFPSRPSLSRAGPAEIRAEHATLGAYRLAADLGPDDTAPRLLFTENAWATRARSIQTSAARRQPRGTASRSAPGSKSCCACGCAPKARRGVRRSELSSTARLPSGSSKRTASTRASRPRPRRPRSARCSGRRAPACSGRNSSTTTTCPNGSPEIRPTLRRQQRGARDATPIGRT